VCGLKFRLYVLFIFLFLTSHVWACEVIDDAGNQIHLTSPAKRIISLAPDLTELLFAAGAAQSIIGVMQGSDYPPAAKKIPIIASYNRFNSEAILASHPDLIVAWVGGTNAAQLQQLKQLNIPVFLSHQRDLTDIPITLRKLGCLAGTEKIANLAATHFEQHYQALQHQYAHQKTISVFYEMWPHPLITVNKDSWINQIIELCGGKNIFASAHGIAPQVNFEAVLAANPDVIISTATSADWKEIWQTWRTLPAVKNQFIYSVNSDWLERAGPRLLNGAEAVCRDIAIGRPGA
jgi:iron complex transport system substrate-binding protein